MGSLSSISFLNYLARLYGIQTAYYDVYHHRQQASTEPLLAVLRALGAPVLTLQDVPAAWRERRQALWQQPLEPVGCYDIQTGQGTDHHGGDAEEQEVKPSGKRHLRAGQGQAQKHPIPPDHRAGLVVCGKMM